MFEVVCVVSMKLQSTVDNVPQALEQYCYEEVPGPNFGSVMSLPEKHNRDFYCRGNKIGAYRIRWDFQGLG
jgi:hypothetical protein